MNTPSSAFFCSSVLQSTAMSTESLHALFELSRPRVLKKGELFLKQGQICNSILFVEKGLLRTYIDKDGSDINTHFTFEGDFTTHLRSLRTAQPSDTNIEALQPTHILEFDKNELLALYAVSAEIESFGRKLVEQLLMQQEEHANLFKLYSPLERYHYVQLHKPELLQRVSLSLLASYLGMARETLSRIRKKSLRDTL